MPGHAVLHHGLQGGRREAGDRSAIARSIALEKVRGKRRNVFAALAQRRNVNLDRVQAEEQVFAKIAGGNRVLQIGVGGRDHAHVDVLGARRANALDLARLQHAQQLGLLAHRDVADLVEEDGAVVGQLEASDAVGARVGEGALHVAEELALEGAFRQRAGIDRDQRHGGARRQARAASARPLPCRCRARR